MRARLFFFSIVFLSVISGAVAEEGKFFHPAPTISPLGCFSKDDRVLVFAPHPDDESIACAGVIQRAVKSGAQVYAAYLTNGDHNEFSFIVYEKHLALRRDEFIHLGQTRQKEARAALKLLGVREENTFFLGYPDFGTFAIFCDYWRPGAPFQDILTRVNKVPYKTDLSYGAPYLAQNILSDLKQVLLKSRPTKVFVSHPADVNVDHKALYLFLEVALAAQINSHIQQLSISDNASELMLAELQKVSDAGEAANFSFKQQLKERIEAVDAQLERLLDFYLSEKILQEEYVSKKQKLLTEKVELKEKLADFGRKGLSRFERVRDFITTCNSAGYIALKGNFPLKREFLLKTGSNFILKNRTLYLSWRSPFSYLPLGAGIEEWRGLLYKVLTFYEVPVDNKLSQDMV
jgi:LmbE family N-acetylglucosaminyl deacetylase